MAEHSSRSLLWFIHRVLKVYRKRLRSKCLFVPSAQNLLNILAQLDIRTAQSMNHRWNAEFCESTFRLRAFIITRLVQNSVPRTAWVMLKRALTKRVSFLSLVANAATLHKPKITLYCNVTSIGHYTEHEV